MATLSIGIPVLNGEQFLESAIRTVLTQSLHEIEVVISDNASTDKTAEICLRLAAVDNRIKYFRQDSTISGIDNFRFVAEAASGDFFAWQAHDDEMHPEFCSVTRTYLLAHPAAVCVTGDFDTIDSEGVVFDTMRLTNIRFDIPWERRIPYFFFQSLTSKAFMCIYGLFRRQCLLEVLGQIKVGPTLSNTEAPILSRLATRGEIASLPVVLRRYRRHENSEYSAECKKMAGFGWKGEWLNFVGRLWYKQDQLRVLLRSSLGWKCKSVVTARVAWYHVERLCTLVRGWLVPRRNREHV
jgi:glycosyltransferase involved in cell wall biosynthesis